VSELLKAAKIWKEERISSLLAKLAAVERKRERLNALTANSPVSKSAEVDIRRELLRESRAVTRELVASRIEFATVLREIFSLRSSIQKEITRVQKSLSVLMLYQQMGEEFSSPMEQALSQDLVQQVNEATLDLARVEQLTRFYYEEVLSISCRAETLASRTVLKIKEQAAWTWLRIESFLYRRHGLLFVLAGGLKPDPAILLTSISVTAIFGCAIFAVVGLDALVETLANVAFICLAMGIGVCLYKLGFAKTLRAPTNDEVTIKYVLEGEGIHHLNASAHVKSGHEILNGEPLDI
jgi:hypothetical protein